MEAFNSINSKSGLTHSGCFLTIFTALAQCAKCGVFSILVAACLECPCLFDKRRHLRSSDRAQTRLQNKGAQTKLKLQFEILCIRDFMIYFISFHYSIVKDSDADLTVEN